MNNNRFFDGLLIGLILGGAAVFLLGTKSGKNLLKILSEQGIDGLKDLMEQYNEDFDEEDLDAQGPIAEEAAKQDLSKESNEEQKEVRQEYTSERPPKKRFFKRFKN